MNHNGNLSVLGALNALRSISVAGNTVGNTSAGHGTLVLAGGPNITLSGSTALGGQTLSISAGGGAPSGFGLGEFTPFYPENLVSVVILTQTNVSQRPLFYPFVLCHSLTHNQLALNMNRVTTGSNLFTLHAALYTYVNSTKMSRLASLSNSYSNTATGSISAVRDFRATGWEAVGSTLSPGPYALMLYVSAANSASMNYAIMGVSSSGPLGIIGPGADNVTTATSQLSSMALYKSFAGRYSVSTASPPATVGLSEIFGYSSNSQIWWAMRST